MPAKPPDIIVERWLPYKQQQRQVIYEKALPDDKKGTSTFERHPSNNLIIQYANPSVRIEKQMRSLGIMRCDPSETRSTSNHSPSKSSGKPIRAMGDDLSRSRRLFQIPSTTIFHSRPTSIGIKHRNSILSPPSTRSSFTKNQSEQHFLSDSFEVYLIVTPFDR